VLLVLSRTIGERGNILNFPLMHFPWMRHCWSSAAKHIWAFCVHKRDPSRHSSISLWLCVRVRVRACAGVYVCVCECVSVCVCVCIHIYIDVCVYVCMFKKRLHTYPGCVCQRKRVAAGAACASRRPPHSLCMCVYKCVRVCVCMCVRVCIHIIIYMYGHIYVCIYICVFE